MTSTPTYQLSVAVPPEERARVVHRLRGVEGLSPETLDAFDQGRVPCIAWGLNEAEARRLLAVVKMRGVEARIELQRVDEPAAEQDVRTSSGLVVAEDVLPGLSAVLAPPQNAALTGVNRGVRTRSMTGVHSRAQLIAPMANVDQVLEPLDDDEPLVPLAGVVSSVSSGQRRRTLNGDDHPVLTLHQTALPGAVPLSDATEASGTATLTPSFAAHPHDPAVVNPTGATEFQGSALDRSCGDATHAMRMSPEEIAAEIRSMPEAHVPAVSDSVLAAAEVSSPPTTDRMGLDSGSDSGFSISQLMRGLDTPIPKAHVPSDSERHSSLEASSVISQLEWAEEATSEAGAPESQAVVDPPVRHFEGPANAEGSATAFATSVFGPTVATLPDIDERARQMLDELEALNADSHSVPLMYGLPEPDLSADESHAAVSRTSDVALADSGIAVPGFGSAAMASADADEPGSRTMSPGTDESAEDSRGLLDFQDRAPSLRSLESISAVEHRRQVAADRPRIQTTESEPGGLYSSLEEELADASDANTGPQRAVRTTSTPAATTRPTPYVPKSRWIGTLIPALIVLGSATMAAASGWLFWVKSAGAVRSSFQDAVRYVEYTEGDGRVGCALLGSSRSLCRADRNWYLERFPELSPLEAEGLSLDCFHHDIDTLDSRQRWFRCATASSAEGYPGSVTLDYRHERRCERELSTVQLSETAECTWSTHSSLTLPTRDTAAVRDETITADVQFARDLENFSSPVGFLSAREYIVRGGTGPTRMLYFVPGLGLIVREQVVGSASPAVQIVARREPSVSEGEVRLRLE